MGPLHAAIVAMKPLLDLLPALAFLGAYLLGDIYTATAVLIGALALVVIAYAILDKRLHRMHASAFAAAAVFGGVTLYLRDPLFIKLKPSIVYGLFGSVLLLSHVIGQKVLLQRIPQKMLVMPDRTWRRVNLAWALFFLSLSALNLYVAEFLDETVWVQLKAYGFTVLTLVFTLALLPFVYKYLPQEQA
jgi:intracellular septation protein